MLLGPLIPAAFVLQLLQHGYSKILSRLRQTFPFQDDPLASNLIGQFPRHREPIRMGLAH